MVYTDERLLRKVAYMKFLNNCKYKPTKSEIACLFELSRRQVDRDLEDFELLSTYESLPESDTPVLSRDFGSEIQKRYCILLAYANMPYAISDISFIFNKPVEDVRAEIASVGIPKEYSIIKSNSSIGRFYDRSMLYKEIFEREEVIQSGGKVKDRTFNIRYLGSLVKATYNTVISDLNRLGYSEKMLELLTDDLSCGRPSKFNTQAKQDKVKELRDEYIAVLKENKRYITTAFLASVMNRTPTTVCKHIDALNLRPLIKKHNKKYAHLRYRFTAYELDCIKNGTYENVEYRQKEIDRIQRILLSMDRIGDSDESLTYEKVSAEVGITKECFRQYLRKYHLEDVYNSYKTKYKVKAAN